MRRKKKELAVSRVVLEPDTVWLEDAIEVTAIGVVVLDTKTLAGEPHDYTLALEIDGRVAGTADVMAHQTLILKPQVAGWIAAQLTVGANEAPRGLDVFLAAMRSQLDSHGGSA
ncbi:MAG: hypothetical protein F2667_14280 [Actinobacteria bacterium]|nr:hypothetical protein [Actinomycetota bacterium]